MKKDLIKKLCTKFFYYWWNREGGNNTELGFEEWWDREGKEIFISHKKKTILDSIASKKNFQDEVRLRACIIEVLHSYIFETTDQAGVEYLAVEQEDFQSVARDIIKKYKGL